MNILDLKDIFYIGGIVLSAVVTFLTTRHKIKEMIRDKHDELKGEIATLRLEKKDEIGELKVELEKLRGRAELQEQITDQFKKQILDNLLPKLFQIIENDKAHGQRTK